MLKPITYPQPLLCICGDVVNLGDFHRQPRPFCVQCCRCGRAGPYGRTAAEATEGFVKDQKALKYAGCDFLDQVEAKWVLKAADIAKEAK